MRSSRDDEQVQDQLPKHEKLAGHLQWPGDVALQHAQPHTQQCARSCSGAGSRSAAQLLLPG